MKKAFMKISTALAAFVLVMNASFASVKGTQKKVYLSQVHESAYSITEKSAANKEYYVAGVKIGNKNTPFSEFFGENKAKGKSAWANVVMKSTLSSNTVSISNNTDTEKNLMVRLSSKSKCDKTKTTNRESKVNNATRVGCGTGYKREASNKNIEYAMIAEIEDVYSKDANIGNTYKNFKCTIDQS